MGTFSNQPLETKILYQLKTGITKQTSCSQMDKLGKPGVIIIKKKK